MTRYLVQRLLGAVGVLAMVSVLVFGLISLLPGDASVALLGSDATATEQAQVRRSLGIDAPVHVRYVTWITHVLRGDFGRSLITQEPVGTLLFQRFGATLLLAIASMLVAASVGIATGILAALRPRSVLDRLTTVLALFGNSTPIFWLGIMFVLLFAQELRWLPTSGMQSPGRTDLVDMLVHLVLPALTIGLVVAGPITRLTRASLVEALRHEYVTTARSKGLQTRVIVMRHALPNALLPVLTVMGIQVGHLLGGAVVAETVFAWPGLGSQIYTSINNRDVPVVIGGVLMIAVTFVLVNLIVDVLYAYLDPRIKYA